MLVKKSIVEKWYQRDSWVFRNFSYLFSNPLWDKHVPNGFSVCPYFWLSLFSFLIFRPFFVFPVRYLLAPIVRLFGRPARFVDRLSVKFNNWLFKFPDENPPPGVGFLLALLDLCFFVLLTFITFGSYAYISEGYEYLGETSYAPFALWSGLSLLGLFSVIGLHKWITESECKTMNYFWIWLAGFFVAALYFIPGDLLSLSQITASVVWILVSGAFIWLGSWAWTILSYIGLGLWYGAVWAFTFKPVNSWLIPWWGYFLGMAAFGWLFAQFSYLLDKWTWDKLEINEKDVYLAKCRDAWINLFVRALQTDKMYGKNNMAISENDELKAQFTESDLWHYQLKTAISLKSRLYAAAFEVMWKDELDKLQEHYPNIYKVSPSRLRSLHSATAAFNVLKEELGIDIKYTTNAMWQAIANAYKQPSVKKEIDEAAAAWMKFDEAAEKRKENRKKSWAHVTCVRVTTAIGDGIGTAAIGLWAGICWVCHQTKILCAYLWMLAKAKKQGACPYFPFTDPK